MIGGFSMKLADIARALDALPVAGDIELTGVSTDTRSLSPGALFVALKGDNFDGHAYLAEAQAKGALAAVVEHRVMGVSLPQVVVQDARIAFGRIACLWRKRFQMPTLALTGSNGKTTVKEMLRGILSLHTGDPAEVLATEGNLNNDIGVPQMLLGLRAHHRYAVFELGMNHPGEIGYLTRLVEPDVAMVIMAGTAHIGVLGSREAIAQAKGEIYGALKADGTALVNMHDRFAHYWRTNLQTSGQRHRIIGFGMTPDDDVAATFGRDARGHNVLGITWRGQKITVNLQVPGEHNQANALAAAAGACALDIPLETIRRGLEGFTGVEGRLRTFTGHNSATIIDDTYNANPDSVKAAIRVLAAHKPPRFLVLGDMGELGDHGAAMHREMGAFARHAGIEKVFALGDLSREIVFAFGAQAAHFNTPDELVSSLRPLLGAQSTVLVKGSRFMKMERVVEQLVPHYCGGHH